MELSKQNRLIKLAYSKGYVVTNCGSKVHNKEGKELRLSKQKRGGKLYLSFNIRPKGKIQQEYMSISYKHIKSSKKVCL